MTKDELSSIKPKYSIVIPVYNESDNIEILNRRLSAVMNAVGETYEIIFVDDGSTDNSFSRLTSIHQEDGNIKVIKLTRNFGQHPALMAGFHSARGEIIITMDADLQNPPEEIPKLINKLGNDCDVVFGVFKNPREPIYRRAGSAFARWVLSSMLPSIPTNMSGFRALKAEVIDQLRLFGEQNKFIDGLICWTGFKIGSVEVERVPRQSGKSKYNLSKLIRLWFDMVVSFSDTPLKIATYGGICLGGIGLVLACCYLIGYFLYGFSPPGFASTVILITIFSGVQLTVLGIIGEYIARINQEGRNRPQYIVREKLG
jgi:glycosyltransferase involved in cell wall biosynthesis